MKINFSSHQLRLYLNRNGFFYSIDFNVLGEIKFGTPIDFSKKKNTIYVPFIYNYSELIFTDEKFTTSPIFCKHSFCCSILLVHDPV